MQSKKDKFYKWARDHYKNELENGNLIITDKSIILKEDNKPDKYLWQDNTGSTKSAKQWES